MQATLTRRGLASSFIAAALYPVSTLAVTTKAPADPILDMIEAHRAAIARDKRAFAALTHARAALAPDLAEIAAERKRACKIRLARRRDLRRATPTTEEGFRALHRHYQTLVPAGDDLDGVRERCRQDFAAAVARFEGRAQA